MTDTLAALFDRVTVMHSSGSWSDAHRDLVEVLGPAVSSDGSAWAVFEPLSLSDEPGPEWSLLARTRDLDLVAATAATLGWAVGPQVSGAHESRVPLRSPAGLTVLAYSPTQDGS
jgi:hypothetical protein